MKALLIGVLVSVAIASAAVSAQASVRPALTRNTHATTLLKRVSVVASEFKFLLTARTAKRGVVIFRVINVGKIKHDFQIKGRKTRLLAHGQTAVLRVVFVRRGHYPFRCTVPGHAALGMRGVFTIT
jgi:uncharacterized cupredoxin-like copper-binding protein